MMKQDLPARRPWWRSAIPVALALIAGVVLLRCLQLSFPPAETDMRLGFMARPSSGGGGTTLLEGAPSEAALLYDDGFNVSTSTTATHGLVVQVSGAGSQAVVLGELGHPGIVRCQRGTTTTGRCSWTIVNLSNAITLGTSNITYVWEGLIRLPTASDGTNTYSVQAGFLDTVTAKSTGFGVDLLYDTTVSPNWICESYDGTVTSTTSGTAVAINTWVKLRVEIESDTTARYYVDDALICTHSADIPTGTAQSTGLGVMILGSAGTTDRFVEIDYQYVRPNFPTPR
jgi:hypothetical protein